MGYKRNIFSDKTIVAAAAAGVLAVSAIVGGALLNSKDNENSNPPITNLSEKETTTKRPVVAEKQTSKEDESGLVVSEQKEVTAIKPEEKDNEQAEKTTQSTDDKKEVVNNNLKNEENAGEASGPVGINFNVSSTLVWPVEGNIIIDYDMENTVYFPTLDLYKCSDSVCIQSEIGTPVYAGHACVIEEISYNSEIGNNVTLSLGNGYMVTYGQLKDLQVEKGATLEGGDLIGYIGNPTKYYSVEGANLYVKMTHNGEPVDPMDFINYEK